MTLAAAAAATTAATAATTAAAAAAAAAVVAVDIFGNSESKSSAPYFAVVFTYCFDMMFVRMEYLTF